MRRLVELAVDRIVAHIESLPSQPSVDVEGAVELARSGKHVVAKLRAICLALPEAVEKTSHGEPTWFAGKGKVFAMLDNHHHGAKHLAVWLPMPPGLQEQLVAADPDRCFRPPYVGPSGWVGVVLDGRTRWDLVSKLLREAFLHVAGARLRAKLVPTHDGPPDRRGSSGPRVPSGTAQMSK